MFNRNLYTNVWWREIRTYTFDGDCTYKQILIYMFSEDCTCSKNYACEAFVSGFFLKGVWNSQKTQGLGKLRKLQYTAKKVGAQKLDFLN